MTELVGVESGTLMMGTKLFRAGDGVIYRDNEYEPMVTGKGWHSRSTDSVKVVGPLSMASYILTFDAKFFPVSDEDAHAADLPTNFEFRVGDVVRWSTPTGMMVSVQRLGGAQWRVTIQKGRDVWEPAYGMTDARGRRLLGARALLIRDGDIYWPWAQSQEASTESHDKKLADAYRMVMRDPHRPMFDVDDVDEMQRRTDELDPPKPKYKHGTIALVEQKASRVGRRVYAKWDIETQMWEASWHAERGGRAGSRHRDVAVKVLEIIRDGEDDEK